MAFGFAVDDIYTLTNSIISQATGRTDLQVNDTSSLVRVGQLLLDTAYDPLLKAISQVWGKTIFSARPYDAKFSGIRADGERFGNAVRKISWSDMDYEESQDWNLADGTSVDMYKINKMKPHQFNFYGSKILQRHRTVFREQLRVAFNNVNEMERFLMSEGVIWQNTLEQTFENLARATVVNMMGALKNMDVAGHGGDYTVIHLLTEYNEATSQELTAEQVFGEADKLTSFMKYFVERINILSELMTERSTLFHANIQETNILRHTPKRLQRLYLYYPLQIKARAEVFPDVFHEGYLSLGDYERVNFWQDIKQPMQINITPQELDADGNAKRGEAVNLDNVIGLMFDYEALGYNPAFEYTSVTPFNSAGGYSNIFMHWRANWWNDVTENAVLFLLD